MAFLPFFITLGHVIVILNKLHGNENSKPLADQDIHVGASPFGGPTPILVHVAHGEAPSSASVRPFTLHG